MESIKSEKLYTYQDYVAWSEDVRCELINGVAFNMSTPSVAHQEVIGNLYISLRAFLRGKSCKVFLSPCEVRFENNNNANTVVEPDLFVVCEKEKITHKGIIGAPSFIIEVLSPSNQAHDTVKKRSLYQQHGVKEYWMIDPIAQWIDKLVLQESGLYSDYIVDKGSIESEVLKGFSIDVCDIFEE